MSLAHALHHTEDIPASALNAFWIDPPGLGIPWVQWLTEYVRVIELGEETPSVWQP